VTSWTWLHRVVVPAVVAAVGATWASVWLSALVHVGTAPADLSYPLVAGPAVVAVVAGALGRRFVPPGCGQAARAALGRPGRAAHPGGAERPRRAGLVPVALVTAVAAGTVAAVGLSAGLVASALGPAGWVVAAFHPWDLHSARATGAAGLAWFVAVAAWTVGLSLSRREVDEPRAVRSSAVAGFALTLFFVVAAVHGGRLEHLAGGAAVLLLVAFPGTAAVLALVHERDLERRALQRSAGPPGSVWFVTFGAPMLLVAGVAVLVALLAGPLGPLVVDAGRQLLVWVVTAVVDALHFLVHLPLRRASHPPAPARQVPPLRRAAPAATHAPLWLTVVASTVAGILLLVGLVAVVRRLWRWYRGRTRSDALAEEPGATTESDSVFSWSHLFAQLRAALRRRRPRLALRRHRPAPSPPERAASDPTLSAASVRAEYRRLLAAAAVAGVARTRAETPLELAARLAECPASRPLAPAAAAGAGGAGRGPAARGRSGSGGVAPGEPGVAAGEPGVAAGEAGVAAGEPGVALGGGAASGVGPTGPEPAGRRGPSEEIGRLTALYHEVRYGGRSDGGGRAEAAARLVGSLLAWLSPPEEN